MSRLEDLINRFTAQRDVLNFAIGKIPAGAGEIAVELGLGSGRTYDHLREKLAGRKVYSFDRSDDAHPGCSPEGELFVEGEITEQLPAFVKGREGRAFLVHMDVGTKSRATDEALYRELEPNVMKLLVPGGILVSDRPLFSPKWKEFDLSSMKLPWAYHCYRLEN